MMCSTFSMSTANWMADRALRSECTTTLATLRCTNTSPGSSPVIWFAGTRLSLHPIHMNLGFCCCVSPLKKPGRARSISAAQARLCLKRSWIVVISELSPRLLCGGADQPGWNVFACEQAGGLRHQLAGTVHLHGLQPRLVGDGLDPAAVLEAKQHAIRRAVRGLRGRGRQDRLPPGFTVEVRAEGARHPAQPGTDAAAGDAVGDVLREPAIGAG